MPEVLEIETIKWRNFLSYSDYDTELKIGQLGPVFIEGKNYETYDEDEEVPFIPSNGAGKSTISEAIIWCLFGRLFGLARPADRIVNWKTKKDCFVEINTKNGWMIKRTRKMDGHDDLIVEFKGQDETRSTNKEAQKFLNYKFGLDFEIFTTGMFFGQHTKSFMEMADNNRKKVLERILGASRINYWAKVAKDKYNEENRKLELDNVRLESLEGNRNEYQEMVESSSLKAKNFEKEKKEQIAQNKSDIESLRLEIENWEGDKKLELESAKKKHEGADAAKTKLSGLSDSVASLSNELNIKNRNIDSNLSKIDKNIEIINKIAKQDLESIEEQHLLADKSEEKYDKLNKERGEAAKALNEAELESKKIQSEFDIRRSKIESEENELKSKIKKIMDSGGTVCSSCGQDIPHGHVEEQCGPSRDRLDELDDELVALNKEEDDNSTKEHEKFRDIENNIADLDKKLSGIKIDRPKVSRQDIKSLKERYARLISENEKLNTEISEDREGISDIEGKIDKKKNSIKKIEAALSSLSIGVSKEDIEREFSDQSVRVERLSNLESKLKENENKKNEHLDIVKDFESKIKKSDEDIDEISSKIDVIKENCVNLNYIFDAYSKRNKVKSIIFNELIPFLNSRVSYYSEIFRCPIRIQFKPNLSVESDKWDYALCSGGQKKKIDLAVMFAIHDLHCSIYGRQCNVMILDEVDGRLDAPAIGHFVDALSNNFTAVENCPDAILIISHKEEMREAFPTKMTVVMDENGDSKIESVV